MTNEKTTIELETLNGNKVYPEIDASKLTGQIAESSTGFATGGDVYAALSGKANKSDIKPQVQANWTETDSEEPSFIRGKPSVPTFVDYNDEDYRGLNPPNDWNCHAITSDELTNKKFIVKLPLNRSMSGSNIRLIGDIYGIRGLASKSSTSELNLKTGYIDSIEITLGDSNGDVINGEPVMRKIVSSEFDLSDRNVSGNSMSQCRFHFSHFGSGSGSATKITTTASYILLIVNLSSSTKFVENNIFQVLINWVQF